MAVRVRTHFVAYPAANARTRLYTVPAGKKAILRTLTYSNDNGSAVLMGTTINGAGFLWQETVQGGDNSKTFQLATVLTAGQYVDVESNAGATNYLLQVAELDERDAPEAQTIYHDQIGVSLKTYSPPAGKRFRIREIVVSPHNGAGFNVNLYIGGIGYLLRTTTKADPNNIVINTDMTVNAGESLGSTANGGTIHAWYSGVLEDA